MTPVAYATYAAQASACSLAERPDLVRELVDATRELWRALETGSQTHPHPTWPWFAFCPVGFSFRSSDASCARDSQMPRPSGTPRAAPQEMGLLAQQISDVTRAARVPTPTWSRLLRAGEPMRLSLVVKASA